MKILVLAGGFDQIALINELKNRNHDVILADYFPNPPAKKYAHKHYQVSTLDEDAIFNLAKKENVDLLTTACTDQALLTVAKVSEKLNLPCYISYETALNVTNKEYMKKVFYDNSIPTSKYFIIKSINDLENIFSQMSFPAVVKPCDCNSSKGVIKVKNTQDAYKAIEDALNLSRSSTAIIEEFKEGIELSVDVWIDQEDAKILSASTTSKIKNNKDSFTIYQSKYPVEISDVAKNKIQDIARKISRSFNLMNCPMLIQLIVNGDEVNVIEFSARMGGGTKYQLIEEMSRINIMQVYVNRVLGDIHQIINPSPSKKLIELNYVYATNGIYQNIINFDTAKETNLIKNYFVYKESGSVIEKATTSSDRIAGFLLEADTPEELLNKRKKAVQLLDVLDKNGHSMMIKDIYGV